MALFNLYVLQVNVTLHLRLRYFITFYSWKSCCCNFEIIEAIKLHWITHGFLDKRSLFNYSRQCDCKGCSSVRTINYRNIGLRLNYMTGNIITPLARDFCHLHLLWTYNPSCVYYCSVSYSYHRTVLRSCLSVCYCIICWLGGILK